MKARDLIEKVKVFAMTHWDWCGPVAGFFVGWVVGKVL